MKVLMLLSELPQFKFMSI